MEMTVTIDGRTLTVVYGEYVNGGFCACPAEGWAADISELDDVFYNTEQLMNVTDEDTARTVAEALKNA